MSHHAKKNVKGMIYVARISQSRQRRMSSSLSTQETFEQVIAVLDMALHEVEGLDSEEFECFLRNETALSMLRRADTITANFSDRQGA